jgi:hypothetical protein
MLSARRSFKMNWRIILMYFASFISLFIVDTAIDFACGPEKDPYDYYISFYHYNQSPQSNYRSFYFTMCTLLYDDTEPQNEQQINSEEWAAYLGKPVKAPDVFKPMYGLSKKADSLLLKQYQDSNYKTPDSLKRNAFLKALSQPRHKAARAYYTTTKYLEFLTDQLYDDQWKPRPRSIKALTQWGQKALANAQIQNDRFLKLRWYYQAQRLFFYAGQDKQSNDVYDKYIATCQSNSHVKYWALSLRAGSERHMGDPVKSAYMFTKLFDQCAERRVQAFNDYRDIKAKTTDVLKCAHSSHERAVVFAMQGFHTPEIDLTDLEQVYHYDPKSPMVGLLLTREVNKLEEAYQSNKINKKPGYYTGRYADYFNNNESKTSRSQFIAYIPKLQGFCKRLASQNRCAKPETGSITLAYLDWMQNKNDEGLNILSAINDRHLGKKLSDQKQLVKLLLLTQKINTLDAVNEAGLLPSLKWLDKKVTSDLKSIRPPKSDRFYDEESGYRSLDYNKYASSSRDFYQRILTPMYLRQHDTTKAALVMLQGALHLHPDGSSDQMYDDQDHALTFIQNDLHSSNLRKLVLWKKQPPTDPFLNLMTQPLKKLSPDFLTELLGTAYLREHNYPSAFATFKTLSHRAFAIPKKSEWDEIQLGDPFVDVLHDFPKKYDTGSQSMAYHKLVFAGTMSRLQRKVGTDPKNAAKYYYKMATALYNTCMDGNSWGLISYEWIGYDRHEPKKYYYYADFVRSQTAANFYGKALHLSNNNEFKARCVFMLAKCEQQQEPYFKINWREGKTTATDIRHIRDNPYFAVLKNNYSHTAFFKHAQTDCSYFDDFIRGR